jgi:hypothetical protein
VSGSYTGDLFYRKIAPFHSLIDLLTGNRYYRRGAAGKTTADFLLEAQRQWAAALSAEYQAVADYNNSLARFQFAKGSMLQHANVIIAEGGLPQCAQVRAVERESERGAALACREKAAPVPHPYNGGDASGGVLPKVPVTTAPSVPALLSGAPSVPEKVSRTNDLFNTNYNPGCLEVQMAPSLGVIDAHKTAPGKSATGKER